jgi:hypothetical protein
MLGRGESADGGVVEIPTASVVGETSRKKRKAGKNL